MKDARFAEFTTPRKPRKIMDELGWAEELDLGDVTRALMQALLIIQDQQAQIDDLRIELDAFRECYPLPDSGKEPTVGCESI